MTEPIGPSTNGPAALTRQALRTPAAAAIAGILFAVLFSTSLVLTRLALPENLGGVDFTAWLAGARKPVTFALTLVPFAGIAFLWFMGVLRDRLGELEDRFFSTVFFGSGLLFLAMIFSSAATAGAILAGYALDPDQLETSGVVLFGRAMMYTIMNVYAVRMAGVFMVSTGTIWIRTRVMPRPFVILTYLLALFFLLAIKMSAWVLLIFPAWVFTVSVFILTGNLRRRTAQTGLPPVH